MPDRQMKIGHRLCHERAHPDSRNDHDQSLPMVLPAPIVAPSRTRVRQGVFVRLRSRRCLRSAVVARGKRSLVKIVPALIITPSSIVTPVANVDEGVDLDAAADPHAVSDVFSRRRCTPSPMCAECRMCALSPNEVLEPTRLRPR